jgi:hypothetical protein
MPACRQFIGKAMFSYRLVPLPNGKEKTQHLFIPLLVVVPFILQDKQLNYSGW